VSATTITLAILLGLVAGVMAGLFGVGGGILFVPTLVALGLGQLAVLEGEHRREEIARMLAGQTITDEARKAAERLMSRSA